MGNIERRLILEFLKEQDENDQKINAELDDGLRKVGALEARFLNNKTKSRRMDRKYAQRIGKGMGKIIFKGIKNKYQAKNSGVKNKRSTFSFYKNQKIYDPIVFMNAVNRLENFNDDEIKNNVDEI